MQTYRMYDVKSDVNGNRGLWFSHGDSGPALVGHVGEWGGCACVGQVSSLHLPLRFAGDLKLLQKNKVLLKNISKEINKKETP